MANIFAHGSQIPLSVSRDKFKLLCIICHISLCCLNHDSALYTLLLQLAALIIGISDCAVEVVGVGGTATAAIESGKTVATFFLGINITALKLILDVSGLDAIPDITHNEVLIAHKLVAWI